MKIEDSWGFHISKIAQEMAVQFGSHLEKEGLESRHYGILLTLYNYDNLTQINIGERLGIDRTTVGQLIDHLKASAFLKRKRNPKDRRQNVLSLTAKGSNLVKNMWKEMQETERSVISNLSDLQRENILTIAEFIKGEINDKN
ncbi:MarR family winged helix-turn-helix transcriptional regulator [Streptococcus dentapri]|uniref:MarR family winged helix-turn-helix transcriptional regulator n=1 Tax=Streptococcus dentapri TaxID=573564 RepID=A0ABV8D0D2_9STRE